MVMLCGALVFGGCVCRAIISRNNAIGVEVFFSDGLWVVSYVYRRSSGSLRQGRHSGPKVCWRDCLEVKGETELGNRSSGHSRYTCTDRISSVSILCEA